MVSRTEIADRLARALEERDEVIFAYLFGSSASGRTHRHSDIDVGVYVDPSALEREGRASPWGYLSEITATLMSAFQTGEVNVIRLDRAPPLLADRVARSGRVLISRDEAVRQEWVVSTKSRYCDLAFVRARLRDALLERVRAGEFGT